MAQYQVADPSVSAMVEKMMKLHADKFIHINAGDIHIVFKSSKKSTWWARVRRVNEVLGTLTNKQIILEVWKEGWEKSDEKQRAFTIYHELMHIERKDDGSYKLRQHDVQDFYEVLKTVGLDHEKIENILPPAV